MTQKRKEKKDSISRINGYTKLMKLSFFFHLHFYFHTFLLICQSSDDCFSSWLKPRTCITPIYS